MGGPDGVAYRIRPCLEKLLSVELSPKGKGALLGTAGSSVKEERRTTEAEEVKKSEQCHLCVKKKDSFSPKLSRQVCITGRAGSPLSKCVESARQTVRLLPQSLVTEWRGEVE